MDKLEDVIELQKQWNNLIDNKCLTKKAMCELCIPFRDKYNLTDGQTLQIARNEVNLQTIRLWLMGKED